MFRSRIPLGWALAVVVVLAAALMPAAGATTRGVQPTSPWYAYDAVLRGAQDQRQAQAISGIQATSLGYAYDAALRAAQRQRQQQGVRGRHRDDNRPRSAGPSSCVKGPPGFP